MLEEKKSFTPVSKNLIKQLEKTNLSKKCILFYSYACRLQAIKNEKSNESENNCLSVPELSKELNLDRRIIKKFCEELVDLGLMYHNVEKSIYENTYQALFLPATAYYENNTWYNDFREFDGAGDIKHLINLYTKEVENPEKCQSGFIKVPDEVLFAKDLDWNEKTWWFIFYTIDSCYKTYAYNSIKKTFAFSKNKKNTEIYAHIENLMEKGYITSYTATKDGIKINITSSKVENNEPVISRRKKETKAKDNIIKVLQTVMESDDYYEPIDLYPYGEEDEEMENKLAYLAIKENEEASKMSKEVNDLLDMLSGRTETKIKTEIKQASEKVENKVEIKKVSREIDEELPEDLDDFLDSFEKDTEEENNIVEMSDESDEELPEDFDDWLENVCV